MLAAASRLTVGACRLPAPRTDVQHIELHGTAIAGGYRLRNE